MQTPKDILFTAEDEFGKTLVIEEQGCRKLIFDSEIEQGCLFLDAPMQIAFEYQTVILQQLEQWYSQKQHSTQQNQNNNSLPSNHPPIRALMLGLGSGTLAQHLLNRFDLNLTVIELRQTVIDCAYNFFALPDTPDIEVMQADAIEFCQQHSYPFDVIIVDIFDAHGEAGHLSNREFLNNLWQLTKNQGVLMFNLWQEWQEHSSSHSTSHSNKNLKATQESQQVLNFWQNFLHNSNAVINDNDNPLLQMNRYNIASSQNLVLTLHKNA